MKVRGTRTHNIWGAMKTRCNNKKTHQYKDYGGRGITVCERWDKSFSAFLEDMGECPAGMSIDRVDNNKGYHKDNCRWATRLEQGENRRSNILITYNNQVHHLSKWCTLLNLEYYTIKRRIGLGWDAKRAFEEPIITPNKSSIEYNGVVKTIPEWSKELGINYQRIVQRLKKGWTIERALETKVKEYIYT